MNILTLASLGIIGGADGPTAIFLTGDWGGLLWMAAGAAALAAVFILRKRKHK